MELDIKHIIYAIIGVTVFFSLLIFSFLGIYKYDPSILGFESEADSLKEQEVVEIIPQDTIPVEPTIEITEDKLRELESYIIDKYSLSIEKDSLLHASKNMLDSITKVYAEVDFYRDSINKINKELSKTNETAMSLRDSLEKYRGMYEKNNKRIALLEKRIEDQEEFIAQKADSSTVMNYEAFAKIYNNSTPEEVAKILEQIDERDAAIILKKMQKKKAGKVLDAMLPEHAAAILLLGGMD